MSQQTHRSAVTLEHKITKCLFSTCHLIIPRFNRQKPLPLNLNWCVVSVLVQNGCRASPRWSYTLVVVEASFPLNTAKRFECLEKCYINAIIFLRIYLLWKSYPSAEQVSFFLALECSECRNYVKRLCDSLL